MHPSSVIICVRPHLQKILRAHVLRCSTASARTLALIVLPGVITGCSGATATPVPHGPSASPMWTMSGGRVKGGLGFMELDPRDYSPPV